MIFLTKLVAISNMNFIVTYEENNVFAIFHN